MLEEIAKIPDGAERTAALVRFVQRLFDPPGAVPVLVGGAAVELYTGGAYTTSDLDFVGHVSAEAADRLKTEGFERRGRHWIHERAQVFLEFPSLDLEPGEVPVWTRVRKQRVRVLSVEDLIVDRLAAWRHWRSPIDGVNAWLLWRSKRSRLDRRRLSRRADSAGVADAYRRLLRFDRKWPTRRPTDQEVREWATDGP